jgi:murein DD-endopeptidase MepM/ murein hydrolase activator NlpD
MGKKPPLSQVFVLAALVVLNAPELVYADPATCDLSPVERTLTGAKLGSYTISAVAMNFKEMTVYIPTDDGSLFPKSIIRPSLSLDLDASAEPGRIMSIVQNTAAGIPGGFDHSEYLDSVSTNGGALQLQGHIQVTDWFTMKGFECKWHSEWWGGYPECSATTWKTIIWSHPFDWNSNSRINAHSSLLPGTRAAPGIPIASREPFDAVTDALVDSNGSVDKHISNDLERAFADTVFWFASIFEGGYFDKFSLEHGLPELTQNDTLPLDARQYLYPADRTLVYRDGLRLAGKEGYKGLWEIFVDTLQFSDSESGFLRSPGLTLRIVYTQDNPRFAKRLTENRDPNDHQPTADIFAKAFFCSSVDVRNKISDFMDDLQSRLEKRPKIRDFSGDRAALRSRVLANYGTAKAKQFLEKYGWIRASADTYSGQLPGADTLQFDKRIFLPWDTLTSFKSFYDLDKASSSCVDRLARRRSGSLNLIRPFDDVGGCSNGNGVSDVQNTILNAIYSTRLASGETNDVAVGTFSSPVSNPTYRGWYYCYRNPRMCVGNNQIMWWQDASKFNARGGQHKGADLIGGSFQSSMPIYAVVPGKIVFSNKDPSGWGNALIIPFEQSGESYFAVYAHLPAAAKSFDGKAVTAGAPLGTTGCTGNSGDGSGNCNIYCLWSGQTRTDEHLHFAILHKTATGNDPVDPIPLLNITVANDNRQFRVLCEGQVVTAHQQIGASRRPAQRR